jgi:hypothetical protein
MNLQSFFKLQGGVMKMIFVVLGILALLTSAACAFRETKRRLLILAAVLLSSLALGCARFRQSDFRIIEFHNEGVVDGYCYITAQLGTALTYARSVQGEQWTCNFLMVGYPVKRLIRKGYSNEELQVHIDMSHEPLAPSGKVPPDFDMDFFIYGGRERDYIPTSLGPNAPADNLPTCSDVPDAKKWNTPCRDDSGILVDPFHKP